MCAAQYKIWGLYFHHVIYLFKDEQIDGVKPFSGSKSRDRL